jgi:hypothetical protein
MGITNERKNLQYQERDKLTEELSFADQARKSWFIDNPSHGCGYLGLPCGGYQLHHFHLRFSIETKHTSSSSGELGANPRKRHH